jgi:hypothetical protein
MKRLFAIGLLLSLLAALPAFAGSVGMFGGKGVRSAGQDPPGRWVYIKGRSGSMRRVEISKARFAYLDTVPRASRAAKPADDLKDGAVVQVTVEQDKRSGEWIASAVLIVKLSGDQHLAQSRAP